VSQRISNGKEDLNSGYESKTIIESALPNANDARVAHSKRNGNKTSIVVCMTKSDVAKGFIERQRLLLDSLGLASNTALNTEYTQLKGNAIGAHQKPDFALEKLQNNLKSAEDIRSNGEKVSEMVEKNAGSTFPCYFDPNVILFKSFGLAKQGEDPGLPLTLILDSNLQTVGILKGKMGSDFPQVLWSEL